MTHGEGVHGARGWAAVNWRSVLLACDMGWEPSRRGNELGLWMVLR